MSVERQQGVLPPIKKEWERRGLGEHIHPDNLSEAINKRRADLFEQSGQTHSEISAVASLLADRGFTSVQIRDFFGQSVGVRFPVGIFESGSV